jgi:hypothetical protein
MLPLTSIGKDHSRQINFANILETDPFHEIKILKTQNIAIGAIFNQNTGRTNDKQA